MTPSSLVRLTLLAAIWGSSFLFMRIAAPVLGAAFVAEARVAFAAVFLAGVAWYTGRKLELRRLWRHYLILGLLNSALPFLLFAYAASTLTASLLAILNSTAPIWGAAIATISGRQSLNSRIVTGLGLGVVGVAILVGPEGSALSSDGLPAVTAAILASLSYGIASFYAENAPKASSFNNAHGSMWAATLWLLPAALLFPPTEVPAPEMLGAVLTLGVLCSGVAYILYFRLIHDEGATSALSVTFLVPVFGVLWGYLVLDETIGWHTVTGAPVVLLGTVLVTGFGLRRLREGR